MEIYTSKGYLILENDVITHWDMEGLENPTTQSTDGNTHTGADTAAVKGYYQPRVFNKRFYRIHSYWKRAHNFRRKR